MTAVPSGICFDIRRLGVLFSIAGGYAAQHMCFGFFENLSVFITAFFGG